MTRRIENILVPLDGSKNSARGLEMAIKIAGSGESTLTGLISIEVPPHSEFKGTGTVSKKAIQEAKKIMKESKISVEKNGLKFKAKIMQGNIGYNIIKTAHSKETKYDMIVIGSRGRSSVKEIFFGSTSNYVIHASKIPILVVK